MVYGIIFILLFAAEQEDILATVHVVSHKRVSGEFMSYESGPLCFTCEAATVPSDCRSVSMCALDEVCYTEQYTNPTTSQIFYRLGCRQSTECLGAQQAGHCFGCCNNSHCNNLLCDTQRNRHRLCYQCDHLIHPLDCEIIEPCKHKDEQCFMETVITDRYNIRYNASCMSTRTCTAMAQNRATRREGVLYNTCAKCCDSDKCNGAGCDHA